MKRIVLMAFIALQTLTVAGCSTVSGVGQDISDTWHSVTGSDSGGSSGSGSSSASTSDSGSNNGSSSATSTTSDSPQK